MRERPTNSDDVIDSRDVIAAIDELQGERDGLESELTEMQAAQAELAADAGDEAHSAAGAAVAAARDALREWDEDNGDELKALQAFQDDASGTSDWRYGETCVRESYFEDYAQQLAEDCAPFSRNSEVGKVLDSWPYRCIDWEKAAHELKMDYFEADFDGVTYYVRS